jgi:hypothetical protein
MQTLFSDFKQIHTHGIEQIADGKFLLLKTESKLSYETVSGEKGNDLGLFIRWTFRLEQFGEAVYSLICEEWALVEFKKGENPHNDMSTLLRNSFEKTKHRFDEQVKGKYFVASDVWKIDDEQIETAVLDLIAYAKRQSLL